MSEYAGEVHTVKSSRKGHQCNWCGQKIEIGQPYKHWLWFCDGDRDTVKAHPECLQYAEDNREDSGYFYLDGDGHRPTLEPKGVE